jgi:hypothetical protein
MEAKSFSTMVGICLFLGGTFSSTNGEERTEHFDRDPGWEGPLWSHHYLDRQQPKHLL